MIYDMAYFDRNVAKRERCLSVKISETREEEGHWKYKEYDVFQLTEDHVDEENEREHTARWTRVNQEHQ